MAVDRVAVCMATFQGEKYLRQQIDSIVAQLGTSDVLLVSDDGSTDGTLQILQLYRDEGKLTLVGSDRAGGVVANFERVLTAAIERGFEIVALSDQDDVWLPGRLDLIRAALGEHQLVRLNGEVVDATLEPVGTRIFDFVAPDRGLFGNFVKNPYVGCCMAFRRKVLQLTLPFPAGLPWHDWYIGLVGDAFFTKTAVEVPTLLFRRHMANASNTGQKTRNSLPKVLLLRLQIAWALSVALFRRATRWQVA